MILIALIAFIFPCNIKVSASSGYSVLIDYNMDAIINYLPSNLHNSLSNELITVESGSTVTVSPFTDTLNCYYKCDWTVDGEIVDLSNYQVTKDITLRAKWTPVKYTIHYNYLNGEENSITNLETTKEYTIESGRINYYRPERRDYVFLDWYTSPSLEDQFLAIYRTEYSIGNIYLYAKWKPIEYKINYNTDAKNIYNLPTYNVESEGFELQDPIKEGHIFVGWFLDKELTRKCTKITSDFTGDINLYPKWTLETYTVTYVLPDGSKSQVEVEYGNTCKLPSTNKSIFEIVKTDVSRKNITGDTTINIYYENIWYVYLIGLVLIIGIVSLIVFFVIKKKRNIHRLRYVYNSANKKSRRWK